MNSPTYWWVRQKQFCFLNLFCTQEPRPKKAFSIVRSCDLGCYNRRRVSLRSCIDRDFCPCQSIHSLLLSTESYNLICLLEVREWNLCARKKLQESNMNFTSRNQRKKWGGGKMNVYHQVKDPGMFPVHLRRRLIAWLTDAHKPGSCPCDIIPHSWQLSSPFGSFPFWTSTKLVLPSWSSIYCSFCLECSLIRHILFPQALATIFLEKMHSTPQPK